MEINPQDLPDGEVYKLLTASIVPRPIAWVSTVDEKGNPNLAPFSFFNAVCALPPTVIFCPGIRRSDKEQKDSYYNVRATGEFVINFTNQATAQAMNITAVEAPSEVNEFERANLTPLASKIVKAPRVKESPISFECKLNQIVTISNEVGGGHIVIGTVVYMHFDEAIMLEGNKIDMRAYQPIGRLVGNDYTNVTDIFSMVRPPSEV